RVERGDRAVREVRGGQRLRRDLAGLEQLQGDLAGRGELGTAADHEHPADRGERNGDRRDRPLEQGQVPLEQVGDLGKAVCELLAPAGQVARQEGERGELVEVRLRRRRGPLGPGRQRQQRLRLASEIGLRIVRDGDRER